MNGKLLNLGYVLLVLTSMLLIQCSDIGFKGDKTTEGSHLNDGELNKENDEGRDITKDQDVVDNSDTMGQFKYARNGSSSVEVVSQQTDSSSTKNFSTTDTSTTDSLTDSHVVSDPSGKEKINTIFTLNTISDATVGKQVTISGLLKDSNENPIVGTSIKVSVKGVEQPSVTTNTSGEFSFSYDVKTSGSHGIKLSYEGDDDHNSSQISRNFDVSKLSSSLSISTLLSDVHELDTINIRGQLLAEDQLTPISRQEVVVDIDGSLNTVTTNSSGEYSKSYTVTTTGSHHIIVSYAGNDIYNETQVSTDFTAAKKNDPVIEKIGSNISLNPVTEALVGRDVSIGGVLKDSNQNPIVGAIIKLKVKGVTQPSSKTNSLGEFSFLYPVKTEGSHKVIVSYSGNSDYNQSEISSSFTASVPKINTSLELKIDRADFYLEETVTIHGSLFKDEDISGVAEASIGIQVNSKKVTVTTDNEGHFNYNYVPTTTGVHKVTVSYLGDSQYNPASSVEDSFTMLPAKIVPAISLDVQDITFGDNETIRVSLPTDATGTVSIDVSGEGSHPKETLTNGAVALDIVTPPVGIYSVKVSYGGNSKYKPVSTTGSFAVNPVVKHNAILKPNSITSVHVGEKTLISGQMINYTYLHGSGIAGATIKLKVDGIDLSSTVTNSLGEFSFTYTAKVAGDHVAKLIFEGDNKFDPAEEQAGFKVLEVNVDPCTVLDLQVNEGGKQSRVSSGNGNVMISGEIFELCQNPGNWMNIAYAPITVIGTYEDGSEEVRFDTQFNASGRASFNCTVTRVGEYHFVIRYEGNPSLGYEPATFETTVTAVP